jgi:hypothetical protein
LLATVRRTYLLYHKCNMFEMRDLSLSIEHTAPRSHMIPGLGTLTVIWVSKYIDSLIILY